MVSVSNVSLSTSASSSAQTSVTVSGTLNFDAGDVGRTYQMAIKIFGEDKADDQLPNDDEVGDDEIFAFLWSSGPVKPISVTKAGPQPFTETRAVSASSVDEDKGSIKIGVINIPGDPIFRSRRDEIYAKVLLSSATISARSATVILDKSGL